MSFSHKNTSVITILSSEHGRLRREQRDIDKRDLQKALKHGSRKKAWSDRWIVEYDGITFVVDRLMRKEVTSYPSPLATAPVSSEDVEAQERTKELIASRPELCHSHTVFVIDNSGSMATHDLDLYRCRQTAAYTMTALEFVAEQLFNGTANNSDVVTLIEFKDTAHCVFVREPVSWVLYNKLLARRDTRDFRERESAKFQDVYLCHSNYGPALDEAEKVLNIGNHETCALSILFLSDGAPTDARQLCFTPQGANKYLEEKVITIARRFEGQLSMTFVGFGSEIQNFETMSRMADSAKRIIGGDHAQFVYCSKMVNIIGSAVSSLVASTTVTRTYLLDKGASSLTRMKRTDVSSESDTREANRWKFFRISAHYVYNPRMVEGFEPNNDIPKGALDKKQIHEGMPHREGPPQFLAINEHYFGKGAERIAFRCHMCDNPSMDSFVFGEMVAKETNEVGRVEEQINFHRSFLETQELAAHLAAEFNKRLQALPSYDPSRTPQLNFLSCSVLVVHDETWPGGLRGVLVERKLDTDKFMWTKWNDNAGGVDGRRGHNPIDVEYEFQQMKRSISGPDVCSTIAEGDSDDDGDDDDSADGASMDVGDGEKDSPEGANYSDYLQAFTHFTHRYTNKKVMVCDLQGVLNTETIPPTFELTDPVIHYSSRRGRRMVFGRTDKGRKGMDLFFHTHKCSVICKHMQLSRKNKQWRDDWHKDKELKLR